MRFLSFIETNSRSLYLGIAALAMVPAFAQSASSTPSSPNAANAAPAGAPAPTSVMPNPAGDKPVRLTLEDALNVALVQNPSVAATADQIAAAQAKVREVLAAVQPQVSATGEYIHQGPIASVSLGGENIKLGSASSKTLTFTAQKDLDIVGKNRLSRDIARKGITSAQLDLAKAQNDLLYSVYGAYYGALQADAAVLVEQEAISDAEEQLRVAKANYDAGTSAEFDVIRAAVQVENLRQSLESAQKQSDLARASLLNVIGLDPDTPLDLAPVTLPAPATASPLVPIGGSPSSDGSPSPTMTTPDATIGAATTQANMDAVLSGLPLDLQGALKEAYGGRPEIQNASTGLSIAERNLSLARKGNKPTFGIGGQYEFAPDSAGLSSTKKSWALTAQITIPIFDGGLTRAKVSEAKANVESAQAGIITTKQAVALDVRGALLDLQEAMRQRQTTAANVVQAREAYRIAQVRFKSGVSTTVEVTDAQVALTQALNNQVTADYSFLTAEARLRKALGRLIPQETKAAVEAKPGPPPADTSGAALPARAGATAPANPQATPSGDQKKQ